MTVLEIALQVAQMLSKEDLIIFLTDGTSIDIANAKRDKQKIVDCLNIVLLELASGPCKIKVLQEFTPMDKKIFYKDFSNKILSITGVLDKKGSVVKHSTFPTYLALYSDKKVVVEYNCLPSKCEIDDEIMLGSPLITSTVLSYGTVAEYYLECSLYDEAVFWRKKFEDALATCMQNKKYKIKGRVFV